MVKFLVYFSLLLFSIFSNLNAQDNYLSNKKVLDSSDLIKWPSIGNCWISPNGGYIGYVIKQPFLQDETLVLSDTGSHWHKRLSSASNVYFSANDKLALFLRHDTLHFTSLGNDNFDRIIKIASWKRPDNGVGQWVAYKEKGLASQLILTNLINESERRFNDVINYQFDKSGTLLLIEQANVHDSSFNYLSVYDLNRNQLYDKVWTGKGDEKVGQIKISDPAENIVFFTSTVKGKTTIRSIWYYRVGEELARLKLKDGDSRISTELRIGGSPEISKNARWISFSLIHPASVIKEDMNSVHVDVWSYRDRYIKPILFKKPTDTAFKAIISVDGDEFRQLESGDNRLVGYSDIAGGIALFVRDDSTWWADEKHHFLQPRSYFLRSISDLGTAYYLGTKALENVAFSPEGRWLIYFDPAEGSFFSYDLKFRKARNLTGGLATSFTSDHLHELSNSAAASVAGWITGDSAVLLYDNYDLWQVNLLGKRPPVNITNGYGYKHRIKLRLLDESFKIPTYSSGDTLLMTGFNVENKYNGFLRQVLGENTDPLVLYMGPYTFYRTLTQKPHGYSFDDGMRPFRARNANCWIIKRQSAVEAPNYFLTNNFTSFQPLTHLSPQKDVNWLTAELVHYRRLDKEPGMGILYRPENFDSKKKYPVILNYYEEISHRLYEFPTPEFMRSNIDVAWFVSRGYLVFTPDISIVSAKKSGKTIGQWAYNSVVAAALYLSKLPYVDKNCIGIQGHSLGGEETNFLVTHSHLFAAAAEMSGVSDGPASYLSLIGGPFSLYDYKDNIFINEAGQLRYGFTLWQRPDLYLRESAILYANKVTTPILIVHNRLDPSVSWSHGVELFLALRRLNKPAWMLQYDEEQHTVETDKNKIDYTTRITQFFDYFLKHTSSPKWLSDKMR